MTGAARADPSTTAPHWDWRDQVTCCLCAPHTGILFSADRKFLWLLSRRRQLAPHQAARLSFIVGQLEHYAEAGGIAWP
jgi:hypothetical protein